MRGAVLCLVVALAGCDRHTQPRFQQEPARCQTVALPPAEAIAEATVARVIALVQRFLQGPAS